MNIQVYKKNIWKRLNNLKQAELDEMSYQYCLFTANIRKFLPEYPKDKYRLFFTNLLYSRQIEAIERYDIKLCKDLKVINSYKYNSDRYPLIFASFHLGPYASITYHLISKGFKVVVIVDHSVYSDSGDEIIRLGNTALTNSKNSDFIVLDIKDKTSLFKLKHLILDGYVISVYIDGNMGVENIRGNYFDKSFTPISFFNNIVYVKNGIAKLSFLLNASIVPVISYRDENENPVIHFYEEIKINDTKNKNEYTSRTIQQLYKILECNLKIYTTQWMEWIPIHTWLKRNWKTPYVSNLKILSLFNKDRYSLFVINNSHFLFDLYDYISYPIKSDLYDYLKNGEINRIDKDRMNELIQKNVII